MAIVGTPWLRGGWRGLVVGALVAALVPAVQTAVAAEPAGAASSLSANATPTPWTTEDSANTSSSADNVLDATSCTSTGFCIAVGYYNVETSGSVDQTLSEVKSGSSWTLLSTPNVPSSDDNDLYGVSCVSSTFCTAVGSYDTTGGVLEPLAEIWNGHSWGISTPAPPTGSQDAELEGVSCVSTTFCVAGGYWYNGSNYPSLIETWNGSAWRVIASPNAPVSGEVDDEFTAVSCTSATFCMAGGLYDNHTTDHVAPLAADWNGSAWTLSSVPDPAPTGGSVFESVSCVETRFCQAAGYLETGGTESSLDEVWNGASWSIAQTQNPNSKADVFFGVSCAATGSCVAVGEQGAAFAGPDRSARTTRGGTLPSWGPRQSRPSRRSSPDAPATADTLVETWDGSSWSVTPSSNVSSSDINVLYGAVCTTAATCVGAGAYGPSGGTPQTLVEAGVLPRASTTTTVSASPSSVAEGQPVRYSATVASASLPVTGMVSFSGGSTPAAPHHILCSAAVVHGTAQCTAAAYGPPGTESILGTYSGDGLHAASVGSASLTVSLSHGYWLVASDGGIFSFGGPFYGSTGNLTLNEPVVGMAAAPGAAGYYLVAADGGIFTFGHIAFHGSLGDVHLNAPIVGMALDPATGGYWLVGADGGVFSFDAPFYGSTGDLKLNQPVVGIAAAANGQGYYLVAKDGGVFTFGPGASFHGSTGDLRLNKPVVGMAYDATTGGYWLVAADGGIFSFNAPFDGSTGDLVLNKPVVGMAPAG